MQQEKSKKYIFVFDREHKCHGRFQIVYATNLEKAQQVMEQNYDRNQGGWHGYSYEHWLEVESFPTEFPLEQILFEDNPSPDTSDSNAYNTYNVYPDEY